MKPELPALPPSWMSPQLGESGGFFLRSLGAGALPGCCFLSRKSPEQEQVSACVSGAPHVPHGDNGWISEISRHPGVGLQQLQEGFPASALVCREIGFHNWDCHQASGEVHSCIKSKSGRRQGRFASCRSVLLNHSTRAPRGAWRSSWGVAESHTALPPLGVQA